MRWPSRSPGLRDLGAEHGFVQAVQRAAEGAALRARSAAGRRRGKRVKYSGVVPSTGKPRCESPSDSGTTQATARCWAMARALSMRMLLVAPPMRNTAYSISCTGPVRAPTIRSVPLTACEKLSRTSVRSRSSVSSSPVASAMHSTTSASVPRRFQALRAARASSAFMRGLAAWLMPAATAARSKRAASRSSWLTKTSVLPAARTVQQHGHEAVAQRGVQRRGGLVGDHQFRRADQRPRRGHALLLADRQLRRRAAEQWSRPGRPGPAARAPPATGVAGARAHARAEKRQGRQHVVQHAQVGQQVELLEDVADVVGAEGSRARRPAPTRAPHQRHWPHAAPARRPAGPAACSCRSRWARAGTPWNSSDISRWITGWATSRVTSPSASARRDIAEVITAMPRPPSTMPRMVRGRITSCERRSVMPARASAMSSCSRTALPGGGPMSGNVGQVAPGHFGLPGQRVVFRHHGHEGIGGERPRHDVLHGQRRAQAEVDLAGTQLLDHLVLVDVQHVDPHTRKLGAEVLDHARHQQGCLQRSRRHLDAPAAQRAQVLRTAERAVQVGQGLARQRQHLGTGLGQPQHARVAVEQPQAEVVLQFAHQRAHRGLREPQPFASAREVRQLCHGDEGAHLAQRQIHTVCR
jgi:hypothetical protein